MKTTLTRASLTLAVLVIVATVAVLVGAASSGAARAHYLAPGRGAGRVSCPVFIGSRANATTGRHECKLPLV